MRGTKKVYWLIAFFMLAAVLASYGLWLFSESLRMRWVQKNNGPWAEWLKLQEDIPYRCGSLGGYELKVDKSYFFFWPTYEGRSDWDKNQGPPPIGCDAKLSSMPLEAYWPGLSPAGKRPIDLDQRPEHISINVESVINRDKWDLILYLALNDGSQIQADEYREDLGLFHFRGADKYSRGREADYYWTVGEGGLISTFIYCGPIRDKYAELCKQVLFIPDMQAALTVRYKSDRLGSWKKITSDVLGFIKSNSKSKGV
ncbi:hypothetical protein [Pseudomonas sp. OA65]|uniref:hypothetical protein n=1 Tax=Pseudomonas sp. OA65 TaxID=2818431 RepID=UPI001A9FE0AB|nr:hypothetical protein [Pseudomonas sp. OA65]MBO1536721.1 hypothetical protein [Pseudomonas sp. OA65]